MLYLGNKVLHQLLDFDQIVKSIEDAYGLQESGDFLMPDRLHLHYEDNTLLYMPCVIEKTFATKIVSVIPDNTSRNLPVVGGIVVLNDKKTGAVQALIDGQSLTAIRTGAVGGTAVKHLVKPASRNLGIIGCGVQGYYQTLFASHMHQFDTITVYDRYGYYDGFKALDVTYASSADEVVELSDVIITATTSYEPLFETQSISDKVFIGIGSFKPDMREYSNQFIEAVDVILTDTPFAIKESGDLKLPLDEGLIEAKDVSVFKPQKYEGSVFFKSVGMALFDNVVAELLYNMALEKKLGLEMEG